MLMSSLRGMCEIPQWFLWRMEWSPDDGKWLKAPCYWHGGPERMDAGKPKNWSPYAAVSERARELNAANDDDSLQYTLGFRLTADCGYWFLDMDKCVTDNVPSLTAAAALALFPGAAWELSMSGTGLHVFGRGRVPQHSCRNKPQGWEFYTDGRGIAFHPDEHVVGDGELDWSVAVSSLVAQYFPPKVRNESWGGAERNPAWRGPESDDELIARALRAKTMDQKFGMGETATFAQLWHNAPELIDFFEEQDGSLAETERDLSLAVRLAWWTGNDANRIERLMWKSACVRDKWYTHSTYLRELTIEEAIDRNGPRCYVEPARDVAKAHAAVYGNGGPPPPPLKSTRAAPAPENTPAAGRPGPPPPPPRTDRRPPPPPRKSAAPAPLSMLPAPSLTHGAVIDGATGEVDATSMYVVAIDEATAQRMAELGEMVSACATMEDMHNEVIPAIRASGINAAYVERFVTTVNNRLKLWDAKLQPAKLRDLLMPPRVKMIPGAPGWLAPFVWCHEMEAFYNLNNGMVMSKTSFNAEFNREMPTKEDGITREDASRFATDVWCLPTVDSVAYRPDEGALFDYEGRNVANTFNAACIPVCESVVEAAGPIGEFQHHLAALCNRRQDVYTQLLAWMAFNTQHPGRKVRWAPLIKGIVGDGKSMIGNVLAAAMGRRHVGVTGNETLCNSGGFTDWATGKAVNVIEEIMLTGKERHKIDNMLKQYISNDHVSINPKGGKHYDTKNTTNHMAVTNYSDAVPIVLPERRWFVIFSPFSEMMDQVKANGFEFEHELEARFGRIFNSLETHPGQWRTWLLSIQMPAEFMPNGHAMMTPEKRMMAGNSADDVELHARSLVKDGGFGIHPQVILTKPFFRRLEQIAATEGFIIPKTTKREYLMTKLGYSRGIRLRWNGENAHTWVRQDCPADPDVMRALLDETAAKFGEPDEKVTF